MAKSKSHQPSLFDVIESREDVDLDQAAALCTSGVSSWQEVPQPVFESWSEARRLDYMARRDDDSAIYSDSDWWTVFYGRRAECYRAGLAGLLAAKIQVSA